MYLCLYSSVGKYFRCVFILQTIGFQLVLPAIAIGLLSVGVLNLNNMRDEASDRKSNKNTIVVKIGGAKAKIYHYILSNGDGFGVDFALYDFN
jgi:1,4-dihydroxy-2-naphthoate octaprenyltransferase